MTPTQKLLNVTGIVLPFVGLVVAIVLLWNRVVGVTQLAILAVGYVLAGAGVTVGYHRLFTHRAFKTHRAAWYAFAVLGQLAAEGDVVTWVANHRKHHQFSDREGDPHSPHADFGDGFLETLKGFWHAHTGWIFSGLGRADRNRYAKDLVDDRGLRILSRLHAPILILSVVLPGLAGWLLVGGWYGLAGGLIWGGGVRIVLLHHVTWSINSVCHLWGRRRFASRDHARNVWWLSLLSFGESWHNNHHAFPSSAFHGLRRFEFDPGGWLIWTLEKLGLAWDVVRIPPERQRAKLVT